MKLYLRRQTITATKGMLSKRTEVSFSLYARLDIDQSERALMQEFLIGREILGSHEAPMPGYKDTIITNSYSAAELIEGKDISCMSFVNLMGLEQSLLKGSQAFAHILEHAKEVKQNHEAVHDFSLAS